MSTASGDEYLIAESATLIAAADAPATPVGASPTSQWPYLLVSVIAVAGLGLIAIGLLREGLLALTAALAVAAGVRLVLPSATAGWLSSRSRTIDAGVFAGLAAALGAVTLMLFP